VTRTLADIRGNAEGLIYTTERSLEEFGHVMPAAARSELEAALHRLRGALDENDAVALETAVLKLEASVHQMADEMGNATRVPRRPARPKILYGRSRPRELDDIADYLLASAAALLPIHREMAPIAAVVDHELGIAAFAVDDDDDAANAESVLGQLVIGLQRGASRGDYIATGTCANVDVRTGRRRSDALLVQLDHAEGTSLVARLAYTIVDQGLRFGAVVVSEGARQIFPRPV
jgi:hypothetical protein